MVEDVIKLPASDRRFSFIASIMSALPLLSISFACLSPSIPVEISGCCAGSLIGSFSASKIFSVPPVSN